MRLKGNGIFLSYKGVQTTDESSTYGDDEVNYTVATIELLKLNTKLNSATITTSLTQTKALIDYLKLKYPPC